MHEVENFELVTEMKCKNAQLLYKNKGIVTNYQAWDYVIISNQCCAKITHTISS